MCIHIYIYIYIYIHMMRTYPLRAKMLNVHDDAGWREADED